MSSFVIIIVATREEAKSLPLAGRSGAQYISIGIRMICTKVKILCVHNYVCRSLNEILRKRTGHARWTDQSRTRLMNFVPDVLVLETTDDENNGEKLF